MPPLPEAMQRLAALAGRWTGEEQVSASPWAPAGPATSCIDCRLELGGSWLEWRYTQQRNGQDSFRVHASLGHDNQHGLALFWFDSAGFVPASPAWGRWLDDHTLEFLRISPRGQARHTWLVTGDGRYDMTISNSADGTHWHEFMRGQYRREHA